MRLKCFAILLCLFIAGGAAAEAAVLRVVAVETTDVAAYAKAIEEGKALLKSKGSPAVIRVWQARYAGTDAGGVVVSVEYESLEKLAADDAKFEADADLQAWLASLAKIRKIVSDSIYVEVE